MLHLSKTVNIIDRSLVHYKYITKTYQKIVNIMDNNMCKYDNSIDHIAFRSLSSNGGIDNIKSVLLEDGLYQQKDNYEFPEKYLSAQWFSPEIKGLPRIFVSQINDEKLSNRSRRIINSYTEQNKQNKTEFNGVSSGKDLWGSVIISDYTSLAEESEYAAWALVFGYIINHVAIPVHLLNKYNNIIDYTSLLINNDIILLNDDKIQVSEDKLLLQGTTKSDLIYGPQHGTDIIRVPGTSVEFIERKETNCINKCRKEGFDSRNANVIFESSAIKLV